MDINAVMAELAKIGADKRGSAHESVARVAAHNRAKFTETSKRWLSSWNKGFKEAHGYDGLAVISKPGFNLKAAFRQLKERGLREDVTTSQVYALAVGLVTQNLSGAYEVVSTIYRDVAKILPSNRAEETYFPLQRADVPVPVEDTEALPSSSIGGNLTRIRNYKFGRIIEFAETLEEDDQTGQVAEVSAGVGEKMVYAEEHWWANQLIQAYAAGNIRQSGGIIPAECIAGQSASDPNYGGPVTSPSIPTRDAFANLYTAADYVTDVEGDLTQVEVDCGVFANADKITVLTILKSDFNPNTPANTPNTTNGIFARNPLEDLFVPKFTRFFKYFTSSTLTSTGNVWFLGEAGKIGAFQERTALKVIMETPNSGRSFDSSVRRTKCERRFGAGVTLPEFALRGN